MQKVCHFYYFTTTVPFHSIHYRQDFHSTGKTTFKNCFKFAESSLLQQILTRSFLFWKKLLEFTFAYSCPISYRQVRKSHCTLYYDINNIQDAGWNVPKGWCMELFRRRRWTTGSAPESNSWGVVKHKSLTLGPIQPSSLPWLVSLLTSISFENLPLVMSSNESLLIFDALRTWPFNTTVEFKSKPKLKIWNFVCYFV